MIRRVYIAGAYSAPTREQIDDNIAHARQAAIYLNHQGYATFCPHLNTAHFEDVMTISSGDWVARCVKWLEVSDCIYILTGSEHSVGTGIELGLAKALGLEIMYEE